MSPIFTPNEAWVCNMQLEEGLPFPTKTEQMQQRAKHVTCILPTTLSKLFS